MIGARCVAVALALAAGATAQNGETDPPLAALHRAWLCEVLDLDVAGAATQYAQLAREARSAQPERWIAVARLAELQRLGLPVPPSPGLAEGPLPLRTAWAQAPATFELRGLMERLHGTPQPHLPDLADVDPAVLVLRPLVPSAEDWLLTQTGPSMRDRRRQRQQAFANLSRSPQTSNYLQRMYAATIVNAEVNGRNSQADALRTLYFATWRPPEVTGGDQAIVQQALTALDAWITDAELGNQSRTMLTSLREHLARKLESDAAEARRIVLRLPRYTERLLGREADDGDRGR